MKENRAANGAHTILSLTVFCLYGDNLYKRIGFARPLKEILQVLWVIAVSPLMSLAHLARWILNTRTLQKEWRLFDVVYKFML
jgi:hypothetical protein